jgi:hypothetical protein
MLYNVSWASQKSGKKPQKALERYTDLVKKQQKQGDTKWIQKTMVKCQARIKKYGINQKMLDDALTRRGLNK